MCMTSNNHTRHNWCRSIPSKYICHFHALFAFFAIKFNLLQSAHLQNKIRSCSWKGKGKFVTFAQDTKAVDYSAYTVDKSRQTILVIPTIDTVPNICSAQGNYTLSAGILQLIFPSFSLVPIYKLKIIFNYGYKIVYVLCFPPFLLHFLHYNQITFIRIGQAMSQKKRLKLAFLY